MMQAFARRVAHMTAELDPSVPWITMFDDTNVELMPTGDFAYAGYVDGRWPTFHEVQKRFPGHKLLDIAVAVGGNATCLDIENGDASIEQAPDWVKQQIRRGVHRPVLYIGAARMKALELTMDAAGVPRTAYRMWSAHYTHTAHLCAPWSCGYGVTEADGTQWTNRALGVSLDQSVLNPEFFDAPVKPAPAGPPWEVTTMNKLPTLQLGSVDKTGHICYVVRAQALVRALANVNNITGAKSLVIDGNFGPGTKDAVEAYQHHFGLTADGVVGQATWELLVAGWSKP